VTLDLEPRLAHLDPAIASRVVQTVSCRDTDSLPKVPGAGESRDHQGDRVQVMHNGLLVKEGGYFGDWMAEIIRCLRGHHEPQEEVVFDAVVRHLLADAPAPTMIELGSYWTYYGLWLCHVAPQARVVALEPDPAYMAVGRRNAELNGFTDRITFVDGAVGGSPGEEIEFLAESDGVRRPTAQFDLDSLMALTGLHRVDLVLADIQGFETVLLERAVETLRAGRVRFLIVSTHHHTISGDALTHQTALALLRGAGAHVIAEHSVGESFSGDGLIAVSFDDRDRDLTVDISHARARDSLFGEVEHDLARALADRRAADVAAELERAETARAREEVRRLRRQVARLRRRNQRLRSELASGAGRSRLARFPRAVVRRVRR
jgi:FkbM family methyltransferase